MYFKLPSLGHIVVLNHGRTARCLVYIADIMIR